MKYGILCCMYAGTLYAKSMSGYNDLHLYGDNTLVICDGKNNDSTTANISLYISTPTTVVAEGEEVIFSAHITNGGGLPLLQWYKNGRKLNASSATYTDDSLAQGDHILCKVWSPNPAEKWISSNELIMSVIKAPLTIPCIAQPDYHIFSSPEQDFIAIQFMGLVKEDLKIQLVDGQYHPLMATVLSKGKTICYLDTPTLYDGRYFVHISAPQCNEYREVIINRP